MGWLQALVLGIVQGLTEFLPISSSAHLVLVPHLTDWPDQGLVADVAANTGTLVAVMLFFRHDLRLFFRATLGRLGALKKGTASTAESDRLVWQILLATLPLAVFGFFGYDFIAGRARDPLLIAVNSILFGIVLWVADRFMARRRPLEQATTRDVFAVGLAQAVALIPGVSRSGITMTAGMALRFDRASAARLSFLFAIPAGLLVAAKDLLDLLTGGASQQGWGPIFLVFVVSGVVGYAVIGFLLSFLRRRSMTSFVIYRVALGVVLLVIFWPR